MLELSRTVRFCLNARRARDGAEPPRHNTFSAWPPMRGLGRYYELDIRCEGEADPVTGYFINIKHIDEAVRSRVLPHLASLVDDASNATGETPMGALMRDIVQRLQPALSGSVVQARLKLTPFYSLEIERNAMDHVVVRQQFEFSAAHRLHVPQLSDEQNRQVFGKCNNPSGHGHNYKLEVAVRAPIRPDGQTLAVETLDALVDDAVIQKLDHKHLNADVPQFAKLNPSVENIARVIYEMLEHEVTRIGVELDSVSVWETGKTVCTYRGQKATAR
jgi:6-pyruvoyltetrahydropterin/6-carboxytetrahydropterin synthase